MVINGEVIVRQMGQEYVAEEGFRPVEDFDRLFIRQTSRGIEIAAATGTTTTTVILS